MAGFEHSDEPKREVEDPAVSAHNARLGLWLFAVYVALYLGFMYVVAFQREAGAAMIGGVNVAIAYGMVLIAAAAGIALVYTFLCRNPSKTEGGK